MKADLVRVVSIVVVPGAGTLTADLWDNGQGRSWLRSLDDPPGSQYVVYEFEHKLLDDKHVLHWNHVNDAGAQLLAALQKITQSDRVRSSQ